jgi:hypothetical protein
MNYPKEVMEALQPFADFGHWIEMNPLLAYLPPDRKLTDHAYSPTVADFKRAAKLLAPVFKCTKPILVKKGEKS